MGEGKIDEAVTTDMSNTVTDYSSPIAQTTTENEFQDTRWSEWLGIYNDIVPVKSMVDKKAMWTVGKGFKADDTTKNILDNIRGNGFDTFNLILQNAVRVYTISEAGFFAEIVRSELTGNLINLKPLNPGTIKVKANDFGMITGFELTLNSINRQSVLETLVQSISSKDNFIDQIFTDAEAVTTWDIKGFPVLMLVDNGMDYRSDDVKKFCLEFDIILDQEIYDLSLLSQREMDPNALNDFIHRSSSVLEKLATQVVGEKKKHQ